MEHRAVYRLKRKELLHSSAAMFLVPILIVPKATPALTQFWIFLERNGNHLLELPGVEGAEAAVAAATEFLATNELSPASPPFCVGDLVFAPVDPADQDLVNFYSWKEVPPGSTPPKEVWRMFLWISSPMDKVHTQDPWGVNRLLDSIQVGEPAHTIFSVLSAYLSAPETLRQAA
jgi:hypothetical protein